MKKFINFGVWLFLILFFFNVLGTNYFYDKFGIFRIFLHDSLEYLEKEKEKKKVILLNNYFTANTTYLNCKNELNTELIHVYVCESKKNEK